MAYEVGDIVQINVVFTINNTRGTIRKASNQLEVEDSGGYTNGDTIMVAGAGIGGRDLITTVTSVVAEIITLNDLAGTTVANTDVGKAADPASVTVTVTAPSGGQASYSGGSGVVLDGPGQYHANYTAVEAGVHYWEAHGTTTATGTIRGYFEVEPAPYAGLSPRALCTLGEVKQLLGNVSSINDDANLIAAINDASEQIHREARREFVARNAVRDPDTGVVTVAPEARRFAIGRTLPDSRLLWVGDLAATSWTLPAPGALTLSIVATEAATPTALDVTDLGYQPSSRDVWQPITRIAIPTTIGLIRGYQLEVTAIWGFPQIPDDVRQACKKLAAGNFLRDTRRWSQSIDDASQDLPRTMIGNALRTVRAYRADPPVVALA